MLKDISWIIVSAAVVNNFTLTLFLGLCSFLGVTSKVSTALRMGAADTFVLVLTSIAAWALNKYVLGFAPYLRIIAFIVVVAALVQIVEMFIKKVSPTLFRELGIYLPLITTNCAILALPLFQTNRGYGFVQGVAFAIEHLLGVLEVAVGEAFLACLEVTVLPVQQSYAGGNHEYDGTSDRQFRAIRLHSGS